jgi:hypothetical protein
VAPIHRLEMACYAGQQRRCRRQGRRRRNPARATSSTSSLQRHFQKHSSRPLCRLHQQRSRRTSSAWLSSTARVVGLTQVKVLRPRLDNHCIAPPKWSRVGAAAAAFPPQWRGEYLIGRAPPPPSGRQRFPKRCFGNLSIQSEGVSARPCRQFDTRSDKHHIKP